MVGVKQVANSVLVFSLFLTTQRDEVCFLTTLSEITPKNLTKQNFELGFLPSLRPSRLVFTRRIWEPRWIDASHRDYPARVRTTEFLTPTQTASAGV